MMLLKAFSLLSRTRSSSRPLMPSCASVTICLTVIVTFSNVLILKPRRFSASLTLMLEYDIANFGSAATVSFFLMALPRFFCQILSSS